jgi:hypothetical protein
MPRDRDPNRRAGKSAKSSQAPRWRSSMIDISRYALSDELAEKIADAFREFTTSEALAWAEVKKLRDRLVEEREKTQAYQFALKVYGWMGE